MDLVKFIKKQMMIDTVFQVLFSKADRFLLKNQSKFVINKSSSDDDEGSNYGEELETIQQEGQQSQFYQGLLRKAGVARQIDKDKQNEQTALEVKPKRDKISLLIQTNASN